MHKDKLGPLYTLIGTLSFIIFGIVGYMDISSPLKPANLIFGTLIGLLFGFLTKFCLVRILALLNFDIKKEHGKQAIGRTVRRSTVFMFPYAVLVFLSTYFLGWATAGIIYAAAILNIGVMSATELEKLKGKTAIMNMLATSVAATLLAYLWLFSGTYLKNVPSLLESLVRLVLPLLGVNI